MKKLLLAAAVTALMNLVPTAALAQALKIGFLDSEQILRDKPGQAVQAKLEAEFGKLAKELQGLDAKLRAAAERFEKDAPALSEAERQRRGRELADQKREIERQSRRFDEDLEQRRNQEAAALNQRVERAVKQIFDRDKYDLILRDSVLMRSPSVDITKQVLDILNAQK